MAETRKSIKNLIKICCGVTATILLILVIIIVTLFFTVLKPKDPQIYLHPLNLENVEVNPFPFRLNARQGLIITIQNPNVASFRIKNSTASVNYHGELVGEIPIGETSVPAKGKLNISTFVEFKAGKILSNPYFLGDFLTGRLDLFAMADLYGKVYLLKKMIKLSAKVYSTCNISIHIFTNIFESSCISRLKL